MAEQISKAAWDAMLYHSDGALPEESSHRLETAFYGNGDSYTVECIVCNEVVVEVDEETLSPAGSMLTAWPRGDDESRRQSRPDDVT